MITQNTNKVTFEENPIGTDSGSTPIEDSIFGASSMLRKGSLFSATLEKGGCIPKNALTKEQLLVALGPIKLKAYQQAARNNPSLAKKLNDEAIAYFSKKASLSTNPQPPVSVEGPSQAYTKVEATSGEQAPVETGAPTARQESQPGEGDAKTEPEAEVATEIYDDATSKNSAQISSSEDRTLNSGEGTTGKVNKGQDPANPKKRNASGAGSKKGEAIGESAPVVGNASRMATTRARSRSTSHMGGTETEAQTQTSTPNDESASGDQVNSS